MSDGTAAKSSNKKKKQSSNHRKRSSGLIEKSDTMKGTETEFEEFVIDRTVTPQRKLKVNEVEKSEEIGNSSQWRKRLESTLLGGEQTPPPEKRSRKSRQKACFNCDGEHNLYDCPLPKDHRKIAANKKKSADEFHRRQQLNNGLTKHVDKGFKPGELSEELRSALGLEEKDIPEHVYRMRRLGFIKGYPPGWLRKAVKSTDDHLKFFTTDAKVQNEDDKLPELDVQKIIWYPGFNGDGSKLNDLETFKVPPQKVFWEVYQKELQDQFKAMKKVKKNQDKRKKKPTHKKFDDDDDDVVIVESNPKSDKFNTPGEEKVVITLNGTPVTPRKSKDVPNVEMGESLFQTVGTPVLNRHQLTDVVSLDAFSVGIQPFQAREEETVNKGNFRKLMDSLKVIREQNPSPPLNDDPEDVIVREGSVDSSDDVVIIEDDEGEKEEIQVQLDTKSLKRKKNRSGGRGAKRQRRENRIIKPK